MNIIPKTQTDKDIQAIEDASSTFSNAINAAIFTLNLAYDALWKLPDDRLVNALQRMYDTKTYDEAGEETGNALFELFTDHNFSATNLNEIQARTHASGIKAIDVLGRQFAIDANGVVSLVYHPAPEPEPIIVEETPVEVIPPQDELP